MCQVIEMLGLRDTQEKATKDTVRNLIYESFLSERGCKYIEKDLMSVLETVLWKAKEHYQKNFVPIGHASYSLTMTIPDQEVQEAKSK